MYIYCDEGSGFVVDYRHYCECLFHRRSAKNLPSAYCPPSWTVIATIGHRHIIHIIYIILLANGCSQNILLLFFYV